MTQTLLLNADARPLTYLPLSTLSWQDAIKMVYLDTALVLETYENWTVRSPSIEMPVPAVIMLRTQAQNVRQWTARDQIAPQRHLVFLRDRYTCQYCHRQFPRSQLTLDHVIPRFHGGKTRWEQVTTSCSPCNGRRGCDIRIQPKTKPFRPTYSQLISNMRQFPTIMPHPAWISWLGWDAEKVQIVDPRRADSQHSPGFLD